MTKKTVQINFAEVLTWDFELKKDDLTIQTDKTPVSGTAIKEKIGKIENVNNFKIGFSVDWEGNHLQCVGTIDGNTLSKKHRSQIDAFLQGLFLDEEIKVVDKFTLKPFFRKDI